MPIVISDLCPRLNKCEFWASERHMAWSDCGVFIMLVHSDARCFTLVAFGGALAPLCGAIKAEDEANQFNRDVGERFRTEAPLAWSELRHFYRQARVLYGSRRFHRQCAGTTLPWTMLFRFNSNADNERFEMESEKSGVLTVILANPDYGAVLSRENSDRPFVVEYLEWDPHSALQQAEAYRIQASGLKVDLESADAIVADPSFKARKCPGTER